MTMKEFETIPVDALRHVGGGNLLNSAQKLYKWWTKTRTRTENISPERIFNKAMAVGGKVGVGVGAAVAGAKALFGGHDE
jgi:hypothetical protein